MGFKFDLEKLSVQVKERAQHASNEETAKQALLFPFLQVLGYDVFNPLEVKSEYYRAGAEDNEKVDLAVCREGKPVIFIDVASEQDENRLRSLAKHFYVTPEVKLAVMTNGITYSFYTDLEAENKMDREPFLVISMDALNDADINTLARFHKESFDAGAVRELAEELTYASSMKAKLDEIFSEPPDEFIRYLLNDHKENNLTSETLARYRPVIKKSISRTILDIISRGLFREEERPEPREQPQEAAEDTGGQAGEQGSEPHPAGESTGNEGARADTPGETVQDESPGPRNETEHTESEVMNQPPKTVTTEEEIQCFRMARELLNQAGKDTANVKYKDTAIDFVVYNRTLLNWFLKINFNVNSQLLITRLPVEKVKSLAPGFNVARRENGESKIYIESPEDLKELNQLIVECYNKTEVS